MSAQPYAWKELAAPAPAVSRATEQLLSGVEPIQARPLSYPLRDYHRAMFEGSLHPQWQDKPHRLVYDLIAAVLHYAALAAPPQSATGERMSALPKPAAFSNVDWDIFRNAEGLEALRRSDPGDQFLAAALTEPWFTAEQMQDYARAAVLRSTGEQA